MLGALRREGHHMSESTWAGLVSFVGLVFVLVELTLIFGGTTLHAGPATVVLAFRLYRRRHVLRRAEAGD
jgi:putative effector of murein hydrolase